MSKITLESTSNRALSLGYVLLNREINSRKDTLYMICPRGHEHNLSYNNFFSNKRMCNKCKKEDKELLNYDSFKELLEISGYELVDERTGIKMKEKKNVICNMTHPWEVSFSDFKSGIRCGSCANNKKLSQEEVEKLYKGYGYRIVTTYENSNSPIVAICPNGHMWKHTHSNFIRGSRCYDCFGSKRHSIEYVYSVFKDKGLTPTFKNYENNKEQLSFLCEKHLDYGIQYCSLHNLMRGLANCQECYRDKFRGENHSMWKGGEHSISKNIRDILYKEWTYPSLEYYNFKCFITGKRGQLEVHHQNKNFHQIMEESLSELKMANKKVRGDFSVEELYLLKNKVLDKHRDHGFGIPVEPKLHRLFHRLYGSRNNNLEQFLEFRKNYENGEFESILSRKEDAV